MEDADILRLGSRGPLADRDQRLPVFPLPVDPDEFVVGKAGEEFTREFLLKNLFETGGGFCCFPAVVKRPGQGEEVRILIRMCLDPFAIDGDGLGGTSRFHQVVGAIPVGGDGIVDGHRMQKDAFLKKGGNAQRKSPGDASGPRGLIL